MENKSLEIQVVGSGCPTCKKLFDLVEKAVLELGMTIHVEYVTDVEKFAALGLMQGPVMLVNGKPALIGFHSKIATIKKAIQDNL